MFFSLYRKLKEKGIVGMNYRNIELIGRYNERKNYPLVDNKLITKKMASEVGILVTELYATIESQSQLKDLAKILEEYESFVIKPNHGSGGKGIVVIDHKDGDHFVKTSGETLHLSDIYKHISNILSGLYSLGGRYDIAIIEKQVVFDPLFENYSYEGVPDIRVIVYKGYPIMAMMRCPTKESDGKANLHQGAVGVGIDIETGETINAVMHNTPLELHPNTKHSFSDLKIPKWKEVLMMASSSYEMTQLGYLGADIVFDKNLGPLLLELNARPGLAIQIANRRGLKERVALIDSLKSSDLTPMERVEYVMSTF